jgi:hypothetical protein
MVKNCPLLPGELRFLVSPLRRRGLITRLEQPRRTGLEQGCSESQKQSHSDIYPDHGSLLPPTHPQHHELGALREHLAAARDCPALTFRMLVIISKAAL